MPSPALIEEARRLLAAGRTREARPLLERLAAAPGCAAGVVLQLAELDIADGEAARALERIAALGERGGDEAAFLAARAAAALGRHDEARAALIALRARLPAPSAMLEMHLAAACQRLGDEAGTFAALRAAIAIDPRLALPRLQLAQSLLAAGRDDEAQRALEEAVAALPRDAALRMRLARRHADRGASAAALEHAARAAESAPDDAEVLRDIGQLFAEYWRWEDAQRALARAARLDPGAAAVETLLAVVEQELGDDAGALQALGRASARHPASLAVALGQRLYLPQVYESREELARWRARYAAGLAEIAAAPERFAPSAAEALELNRTNFLLAYQGEDDRELQRGYSRLLGRMAAAVHPEWAGPRAPRFDGGRRLRIGFAGAIFRECTAGRYFERWITGLDPRRFERFVYHAAPIADALTARIAQSAEHFATVREGGARTAARIAADELDVLVQPEVGMTPLSYLLAALRLAPVQCAGWGHPVTTGGDGVDYFITCAAMEPADGARHYVERLIALPGLGVDYPMPEAPVALPRAQLGLAEGQRLYLCAQSLFKVHPDMDELVARLAEADEEGAIVFFQATARGVTERFARRVQRALAARGVAPRGQVKFVPRLDAATFRRVLACADVVLDTPHWSGGNTSLDAFAAGTPVLALPGRFMRGRQTAAMLAMMALPELVASSPDDYVAKAVSVARDRDLNAHLRSRIHAGRGALFDRPEPVAALQEALLAAAARGARPGV